MSHDPATPAIAQRSAGDTPATTPSAQSYSGRFVVRIPPSLHRDLVRCAEQEGVSLNQFATVALARAAGWCEEVSARARD